MGTTDTSDAQQAQEENIEALFAELEEDDYSAYRDQRLQSLQDAARASGTNKTLNDAEGTILELKSDDDILSFTTEHERAVIHFLHPDFIRCQIMDDHCRRIAKDHAANFDANVAFARIDVKRAPFVVEKLGVRVLPCVIGFVKGVSKGRIIGFEGICWDGRERSINVTQAIEETLVGWKVLSECVLTANDADLSEDDGQAPGGRLARGTIRGPNQMKTVDDDDYGDEWD